jgi:ssDNA-binding replication factor A large subunit
LKETIEEDDWDALRALVHSKATLAVKQEDENAPLPIEEEPEVVPLEDVWPLQKTISRRFRNGSTQKWWALPKATG